METTCRISSPPGSDALPLISIRDLRWADRSRRRDVAQRIGEAARDFGFFRICDHGISPHLIAATYQQAEWFFAQPEAAKMRLYIGHSRNHRGYVPFSEVGDYADEKQRNYEAFDLGQDLPGDDPDYLAGNRLLGPNVWPQDRAFRQIVSLYFSEVAELGALITAALEMFLQLPEGAMARQMTKPISQLRLLHYLHRDSATDRRSVNMGAHTDYECLTLLHTRNPGLQVLSQSDRWIDVPVDHAVYVVNIGDMLEAWSNGMLRSTPHRVLNSSRERFSMPYFVAANHDAMIAPFPQLISHDRPARYQPFQAGLHLERMLMRDFPYLRKAAQSDSLAETAELTISNPFEKRLEQSSD